MANLKALNKEELDYLNDKYTFELLENKYIVVHCKGYNRKVLHELDQSINLNTPIRRILINPETIRLWIENFKAEYSLLDVQNAINSLIITYQDVNLEDIKLQLLRGTTTIKTIN